MKEKRTGLVWRKSIYDNGFRCTECDVLLMRPDGSLVDRALIRRKGMYICRTCSRVVAYQVTAVVDAVVDSDSPRLMGSYEDFKRRNMS